jgi:hypothetical protein
MSADMAQGCAGRERKAAPVFRPHKPVDPDLPKAAVRRLFDQFKGIKRVAARLGYRSESQVYAMADGNDPAEITFAQVVQLTGPDTPAAAEYLAQIGGGVFLPLPAPCSPIAALTADAMREAGQAGGQLVEALADGMTPAEALKVLPEVADVIRKYCQLHSQLQALAKERQETG